MRKIGIYNKKLVRLSPQIDKITLFDRILHLGGIHLLKISSENVIYCRLCSNIREVLSKEKNQ